MFLLATCLGILSGLIWGLGIFIRKLFKNGKIITIICDMVFSIIISIILLYLLFIIENGYFRIYDIIAFSLGLIIERISIGNLFASLYYSVYNKIVENRGANKNYDKQNENVSSKT